MTDAEFDPAAVRGAAAPFGIDLSDDAAAEFVEAAAGVAAQVASLPVDAGSSDPARAVRPGDDEHNAFLYRFDLDAPDGPLSDLSVAVKDNVAVAGVPMTCGSAAVDVTPDRHATVVDRLRTAGAAVAGTTNMDDFAYFTTGETCAHGRIENPRVDGVVPGGSSSGNGAAIAAGLVDAAIGSDTGGSVRIPASFCGVVGLKPTHRSVPRAGFVDLAPSLDHLGPLADSVGTAARVFDAVAGPDPRDPSSYPSRPPSDVADAADRGVDGLRVGVVEEAMGLSADPVAERVEAASGTLADAGASVERVSVPGYQTAPLALLGVTGPEFAALVRRNGQVYGAGTGYDEGWRETVVGLREEGAFGENVAEQLVLGEAVDRAGDGCHYVTAQNARAAFVGAVRERMADYDALVTPTTPVAAPAFGEIAGLDDLVRTIANTAPFNLTGQPALSVPCGTTPEGKPVGCQVVAGWNEEPTAVALGAEVERGTRPIDP